MCLCLCHFWLKPDWQPGAFELSPKMAMVGAEIGAGLSEWVLELWLRELGMPKCMGLASTWVEETGAAAGDRGAR